MNKFFTNLGDKAGTSAAGHCILLEGNVTKLTLKNPKVA